MQVNVIKATPSQSVPTLGSASTILFEKNYSHNYIIIMADLRFVWDIRKEKINISKHSVSFTEAESVFYDEFAIEFFDDDHSDEEIRYLLLGLSNKLRLIILVFTLRDEGKTIRIISARKATKSESTFYPYNRK